MSKTLVERLAETWDRAGYYPDASEAIARWAINAIADELEAANGMELHSDFYRERCNCGYRAAGWLREQSEV